MPGAATSHFMSTRVRSGARSPALVKPKVTGDATRNGAGIEQGLHFLTSIIARAFSCRFHATKIGRHTNRTPLRHCFSTKQSLPFLFSCLIGSKGSSLQISIFALAHLGMLNDIPAQRDIGRNRCRFHLLCFHENASTFGPRPAITPIRGP